MDSEEILLMTGDILDDQSQLTLAEISRACAVHAEKIIELIEEGIILPARDAPNWRFSGHHLRRARVAIRLQVDLGVNLAGVALALQLLDELESLRFRGSVREE